MLAAIASVVPDVRLNGAADGRLPGSLNLSFPGVAATRLLRELPVLALSTGSACSSADGKPSRVLAAIGLDADAGASSLRICLGRNNTAAEAAYATDRIIAAVEKVRREEGA